MKAYIDIEQSKKLAEFLPLESADMIWISIDNDDSFDGSWEVLPKTSSLIAKDDNQMPCWSLAALLEIIPSEIFSNKYIINITEGLGNRWIITYDNIDNKVYSFYGLSSSADNLVDSCYEIILKLHERKLL